MQLDRSGASAMQALPSAQEIIRLRRIVQNLSVTGAVFSAFIHALSAWLIERAFARAGKGPGQAHIQRFYGEFPLQPCREGKHVLRVNGRNDAAQKFRHESAPLRVMAKLQEVREES